MDLPLFVDLFLGSLERGEAWLALLGWVEEQGIDYILLRDLDGLEESLVLCHVVEEVGLEVPVHDEERQF